MAVAALPEHDNIVGQFRAWQQEGHFYIQMDLCEGGSLAHLLQEVGSADGLWLGSSGQTNLTSYAVWARPALEAQGLMSYIAAVSSILAWFTLLLCMLHIELLWKPVPAAAQP